MCEELNHPQKQSFYTIHHVLGRVAGRLICSLTLTDPSVHGEKYLEDLPRPYMVVMNHFSSLDPVLIWAYYPDTLSFFIKQELHEVPFLASISQLAGNIPVKRDHYDLSAIKSALKHLKEGFNLGIFAEGTRSRDGEVHELHPSVFSLANKARVPLVPVYIHGTLEACPSGSHFPKARPTSIHILQPCLKMTEGGLNKEELRVVAEELQESLAEKQRELNEKQ